MAAIEGRDAAVQAVWTTRRPTSATRSAVKPKCSKIVPAGADGAVVVEPDDRALVADPALPAQRHADLDADPLADGRRQDRVAIGLVLRVEPLPAGERHDAGRDALALERLGGGERELELRARRR